MSKSLKRVRAALREAGLEPDIRETSLARTARDAAAAIGCEIDQIAKSIVFRGAEDDSALLFITAGGNQVVPQRAEALAGQPLVKADAGFIRARTGFAIGGVAPIGHIGRTRAWIDPALMGFAQVWAAAGTPHHVFAITPAALIALSCAARGDFTG